MWRSEKQSGKSHKQNHCRPCQHEYQKTEEIKRDWIDNLGGGIIGENKGSEYRYLDWHQNYCAQSNRVQCVYAGGDKSLRTGACQGNSRRPIAYPAKNIKKRQEDHGSGFDTVGDKSNNVDRKNVTRFEDEKREEAQPDRLLGMRRGACNFCVARE